MREYCAADGVTPSSRPLDRRDSRSRTNIITSGKSEQANNICIYCAGKYSKPPQVSSEVMKCMMSGNATQEEFLSILFPNKWVQENTDYIKNNIVVPAGKVSRESLFHEAEANSKWQGTCDRLDQLTLPTLVLTGTDDITSPPSNS